MRANEQGMALPMALIFLLVLSALAAALMAVGTSDVQIASNHLRSTQALFLAEAGLEDAFGAFRTDSTPLDAPPAALTNVPGLTGVGASSLAAFGTYAVQYRAVGPRTAMVVSTATLAQGGQRILRAVMTDGFSPGGAVLTNGNLTINGNPDVLGSCGSVHTNSHLVMSGGTIDLAGGASASGTSSGNYSVPPSTVNIPGTSGAKRKAIPKISADWALQQAQMDPVASASLYQLTKTGDVYKWNTSTQVFVFVESQSTPAASRTILKGSSPGWEFSTGSPPLWTLNGNSAPPAATYFLEGDVLVSGSPGSAAAPASLTLIAKDTQPSGAPDRGGDILISGNPTFTPHMPGLLMTADRDVEIAGNPGAGQTNYQGAILAHEQIKVVGNPAIKGNLIAEDAETLSNLVVLNDIAGNPTITYDCDTNLVYAGPLFIVSWGL